MNKKIAIFIGVVVLVIAGISVWRYKTASATGSGVPSVAIQSLSDEDLQVILKSQMQASPGDALAITETPERRRAFLDGLKEYLALAAEARREGLSSDKAFAINFAFKTNALLADMYKAKLSTDQGSQVTVTLEEAEKVWANPANEKQFSVDMDTLQAIQTASFRMRGGSEYVPTKLQGESLTKARESWARNKILSDRAKADSEFMTRKEVSLRVGILEAGILSADLLRKHYPDRIRATNAEIESFISAHPQYDLNAKYKKAEDVLRRVREGEDFAKLAAQISEHRPTKLQGGLMEPSRTGEMWQSVEAAALALEPGQIADRLVESEMGVHIIRLEKKDITKSKDGAISGTFTIRHILFQNKFEEPDVRDPTIPPPFMTAKEIATAQVEKDKRDRFVADIVARNPVSLPEDFKLGD